MTDVLADEIVARDGDEMSPTDVAELMEDLRHAHRDRGLARPGIAGEAHVQGRRLRGEAEPRAHAVDEQERRDFANALLDGGETDQLVVELLEYGAHPRLFELVR